MKVKQLQQPLGFLTKAAWFHYRHPFLCAPNPTQPTPLSTIVVTITENEASSHIGVSHWCWFTMAIKSVLFQC